MDIKSRKLLEELVDSGLLNAWEQNAFEDMVNRDDQFNITLSIKQGALLNKAKARYFEGKDVDKGSNLPDEYDNCAIVTGPDGSFIHVEGAPVGSAVTKKDGQVILAWLTGALPDMGGGNTKTTPEPAEDKAMEFPPTEDKDDDIPYDDVKTTKEEESEEDPF